MSLVPIRSKHQRDDDVDPARLNHNQPDDIGFVVYYLIATPGK